MYIDLTQKILITSLSTVITLHLMQDFTDLVNRQYGGKKVLSFDTPQVFKPAGFDVEHLAVLEHQGVERLGLGAGGETAFCDQVIEKILHLGFTEIPRVVFVMEENVLTAPIYIPLGLTCRAVAENITGRTV